MSAGPATLEALAEDQRFDNQLELVRQHWAAARRLWIDNPNPLKVARLGPDLAPDFIFDAGMPGLATIRPTRDDRFEFAEDGLTAVIVPCYDTIPGILDANPGRHVEELRDLVAVDLDRPDRYWRRRGEALVLGAAYLEIARQECEPITVFKNPMSWLGSAGAGIVVLDLDWARNLLLGVRCFDGRGHELGRSTLALTWS